MPAWVPACAGMTEWMSLRHTEISMLPPNLEKKDALALLLLFWGAATGEGRHAAAETGETTA
jgi:hypothetical protein